MPPSHAEATLSLAAEGCPEGMVRSDVSADPQAFKVDHSWYDWTANHLSALPPVM